MVKRAGSRSGYSGWRPLSIQQAEQDFGVGGFDEVGVESTRQCSHTIVFLAVTGHGDESGLGGSRVHAKRRATA